MSLPRAHSSNPDFSSLNLAAAVQVLSYEVRMAWLAAGEAPGKVEKVDAAELATMDEMELFYDHLEKTLVGIGFLDPEKPKHLMPRLRRLYGRVAVERSEMSILRGILTETQKVVRASRINGRTDRCSNVCVKIFKAYSTVTRLHAMPSRCSLATPACMPSGCTAWAMRCGGVISNGWPGWCRTSVAG